MPILLYSLDSNRTSESTLAFGVAAKFPQCSISNNGRIEIGSTHLEETILGPLGHLGTSW